MGRLDFSSVYREGIAAVLFLQSYRLNLGNESVYLGVCLALFSQALSLYLTSSRTANFRTEDVGAHGRTS